LLSGSFRAGQSLTLEPGGRSVRVRGMQTHGRVEELALAGSRVALNLAGVEVAEVSRGQTLVAPETLTAVTSIDVEAWLLPESSPLKHGSVVHFHAFTSNTLASVLLYGPGRFEAGSSRLLRIKLQSPILLTAGDAFVLRQVSPPATVGGGRVLDAHPVARLRKAQAMAWLESLRSASDEERLFLRVARRGTKGLSSQHLIAETGLAREATVRMLQPLILSHRLLQIPGELLLAAPALDAACEGIGSVLQQHASGLKRSELKSRTSLGAEVLDFSLQRLARAEKLRLKGELVYPVEGGTPPSAPEDANLSMIAAIYRKAGLSAPLISEVRATLNLKESEMRGLVTSLLREKILVPMGSENLFMHHEALDQLRAEISELHGQTVDVARFKQITGLSRKYAIPLLEYLDRQRITRKVGDQRLVI
jgi:selenocysteine-specific elongation factor